MIFSWGECTWYHETDKEEIEALRNHDLEESFGESLTDHNSHAQNFLLDIVQLITALLTREWQPPFRQNNWFPLLNHMQPYALYKHLRKAFFQRAPPYALLIKMC